MSTIKNILAAFGGAVALNALHQILKNQSGTPRIDLVGEEALQKTLEPLDAEIDDPQKLFLATLGADLVSNTMYYSAIGVGSRDQLWTRALTLGLTAGIGAVELPDAVGLDDSPVASTTSKKTLTVGYYLFGALVTAGILAVIDKQSE